MPEAEAPAQPEDELAGTPSPVAVVEIRNVSKWFGQTQALDDVSIAFQPGEVHALLGENGAGKSTLIKVMTGVQEPDAGRLFIDGQPAHIRNALDAQQYGRPASCTRPAAARYIASAGPVRRRPVVSPARPPAQRRRCARGREVSRPRVGDCRRWASGRAG